MFAILFCFFTVSFFHKKVMSGNLYYKKYHFKLIKLMHSVSMTPRASWPEESVASTELFSICTYMYEYGKSFCIVGEDYI